jgi:hypothetical protein
LISAIRRGVTVKVVSESSRALFIQVLYCRSWYLYLVQFQEGWTREEREEESGDKSGWTKEEGGEQRRSSQGGEDQEKYLLIAELVGGAAFITPK